ncbi:MAG: ATP-dependent helicase, partial [Deinococcota bacterium]
MPAVSAALSLNVKAVRDLGLTRTPFGYKGRSQVKDAGRLYRQSFMLNREGIFTGGECGCGKKGCPHLARVLLSPALERALAEVAGAGTEEASEAATDPVLPPPEPEGEMDAPLVPLASPLRTWLSHAADLGGRLEAALHFELDVQVRARSGREVLTVQVRRTSLLKGQPHSTSVYALPHALRWSHGPASTKSLPRYARPDREVLQLLALGAESGVQGGEETWFLGNHPLTDTLLARLLATGRLYRVGAREPLRPGPEQQVGYDWEMDAGGVQRPAVRLPAGVRVLPVSPRWYLDEKAGTLGRLISALPPALEEAFLEVPPVPPAQAASFARALRESFPGLDVPTPRPVRTVRTPLQYQPVLTLREEEVEVSRRQGWRRVSVVERLGVAHLAHHYGGKPLDIAWQHYEGGVLHLAGRDPAAEKKTTGQVTRTGLKRLQTLQPRGDHLRHHDADRLYAFAHEADWQRFLTVEVPKLEAKGFRVVVEDNFPYRFAEVEDWYGEAHEEGGWFTLELGVIVDGQRHSLIPILVSLIAEHPELFTPEALAALKDDEPITARLPDGRRLLLPAGRVRAILSVLVELHLRDQPEGPLRLPILDAARLALLDEALRARWLGADHLLELGRRLRSFQGVGEVAPPAGLNAGLRPYQQQGLAWLQFLREYDLGGILADD